MDAALPFSVPHPDLLYFGKRDLPLLPVCEKQHLMRHLKTGKLMFFCTFRFQDDLI